MKATLLDHMGSDKDVADAARVSFHKKAENYDNLANERLILYLAKHGHWSPFAHCFAKFHITAPVFVARQLVKHQVGFAWNEVSRRYVDEDPAFYYPDKWRKRAENKKQGSGEEFKGTVYSRNSYGVYDQDYPDAIVRDACSHAYELYRKFINAGVCPEQARMILPQNMMTEWIWSGSLMAWARMCSLRLKEDTQEETRMIAQQVDEQIGPKFPASWAALVKLGGAI